MDENSLPSDPSLVSNFGAQQLQGTALPHQLLGVSPTQLGQYGVDYGLDTFEFNYTTTPSTFNYTRPLFNLDHVPVVLLWHLGYQDSASGNVKTQQAYRVDNDGLQWDKEEFTFSFLFSGAANGTRTDWFYYMVLPLNFMTNVARQAL